MSDRTFFIRVNMDDMAAEIIGLDSTDERGHWLEGFVVGSRGKDCRVDWPAPKLEGHAFGLHCFNEAEEFRGKQSAKGLASADARRNRISTTVEPNINHGSTTVQPDINQASTYPTSNNQQPITNNEKPKKARQAAFDPSVFDALIPVEFARAGAFVAAWHKWVKHRKERRPTLTESQAEAQLGKLAKDPGNPVTAIEWIEHSIASGYQGVFAPKVFGGFQAPKPAAAADEWAIPPSPFKVFR